MKYCNDWISSNHCTADLFAARKMSEKIQLQCIAYDTATLKPGKRSLSFFQDRQSSFVNSDDRKFLAVLLRALRWMVIADAGFLSKDWAATWAQRMSRSALMAWWQHELLKMCQQVEIRLGVIKHCIQQAVMLARFIVGYMARWIYAVLALQLVP